MNYQHRELFDLFQWLLPLALLHLALGLQLWWWQRRQFDADLLERFGPAVSLWRTLLKWALWSGAAVFLVYALAVPLGPPTKVEGDESGADVILVVDVSSSMHAQDIKPDRLAALKQALIGFVERLDSDRVGLVAFAGEAIIACPLTSDSETMSLFLSKLDTDSVPSDGTGLAPALKLALDGFLPDPKRGRLIMLATDGEDTANSDVLAQAERAAKAGIPVFTLGIGTPEGALIPSRPDVFGRVYAKTYQGQPVRTKLDSATLERIAAITGARYFEGSSAASLAAAYARLRSLKQGLAKSQEKYTREPLYQKPLLWAFWLLFIEALLSVRSYGWSKLYGRLRRLAGPLVLVLLLAGPAQAGWFGGGKAGRQEYNEGNRLFREGKYEEAVKVYSQSLEKEPNGNDAAYNIGLAMERMNDPETAVDAYQEALRLDPKDEQAQKSLERALKKIPPAKPGQGGRASKPGASPGPGEKKSFVEALKQKMAQSPPKPFLGGRPGQPGDGQKAIAPRPDPRTRAPNAMDRPGAPGAPQNMEQQAGRGQSQSATGSGTSPGQGDSKAEKDRQAAAASLNQDQVQAMMNQLKNDERRYADAFNPTKKFDQNQEQPQDAMDEMLQQMGLRPRKEVQQGQGGPERKDW
jgi:Ca-activated chloride channel family protein